MNNYYILSLKHSPAQGLAVWWRANDCGYTDNLDQAVLYSEAKINQSPSYYNNGESTLAVEESVAIRASRPVVDWHKVKPVD